MKEALQLSDAEAERVQSALDRFLTGYAAAQSQKMLVVEPMKQDLRGHAPEETRVYEMASIGAEFGNLRQELLDSANATLGPERLKIFQKGLEDVIPMVDDSGGLNSGMIVYNFDCRECFYQPKPGDSYINWTLSSTNRRSTISCPIPLDEISGVHRTQLEDWIALAKSKPPGGDR
jgi:hypothetical protein